MTHADARPVKRVLMVTETGDAWPSGFVRAMIYESRLASSGLEVRHECRRPPWSTRVLERPGRLARRAFALGARPAFVRLGGWLTAAREARIRSLARGFDVVYLQKTSSWSLVAALRRLPGKRLVYDLNDAVWLPRWNGFAQGRVVPILEAVDAVTCDNDSTLAFARAHNAHCYLVPDPPQIERFDALRDRVPRREGAAVLGWVGSPGTAFNLFSIWEALERVFERHAGITLRIVGVGRDSGRLPPFEQVRYTTLPSYTQDEMVREVLQMDIGLFPLFDVEDSRTRGVLKAAVYMSGEAALVCAPIGQCADLVQDGVNGMIARTTEEWERRIETLVTDEPLRRRLAAAGLGTVRRRFSTDACFARLRAALLGEAAPPDGPLS